MCRTTAASVVKEREVRSSTCGPHAPKNC